MTRAILEASDPPLHTWTCSNPFSLSGGGACIFPDPGELLSIWRVTWSPGAYPMDSLRCSKTCLGKRHSLQVTRNLLEHFATASLRSHEEPPGWSPGGSSRVCGSCQKSCLLPVGPDQSQLWGDVSDPGAHELPGNLLGGDVLCTGNGEGGSGD